MLIAASDGDDDGVEDVKTLVEIDELVSFGGLGVEDGGGRPLSDDRGDDFDGCDMLYSCRQQ